MKGLAIAVGLVALALGIVAGVVLGLGDDEILVSPPQVVAQEFVRAVAQGQTTAARGMLTREAERYTSSADMRRISAAFRSRIGRLDDVQGRVAARRRDTMMVRAHVEGERASGELVLPLVREYGEWSVARAGDISGLVTDTATRSTPRR